MQYRKFIDNETLPVLELYPVFPGFVHSSKVANMAMLAVMVTLGRLRLAPQRHAAACANGVYQAGCVGSNGLAVSGGCINISGH